MNEYMMQKDTYDSALKPGLANEHIKEGDYQQRKLSLSKNVI